MAQLQQEVELGHSGEGSLLARLLQEKGESHGTVERRKRITFLANSVKLTSKRLSWTELEWLLTIDTPNWDVLATLIEQDPKTDWIRPFIKRKGILTKKDLKAIKR